MSASLLVFILLCSPGLGVCQLLRVKFAYSYSFRGFVPHWPPHTRIPELTSRENGENVIWPGPRVWSVSHGGHNGQWLIKIIISHVSLGMKV